MSVTAVNKFAKNKKMKEHQQRNKEKKGILQENKEQKRVYRRNCYRNRSDVKIEKLKEYAKTYFKKQNQL